jgi:hypothetical protein
MMNGFRRYLGGGRYMGIVGQVELCADGITASIHGDGGTRAMFEFLPTDDEKVTAMTPTPEELEDLQRDARSVAEAVAEAEADPDDDPYAPVPEHPLKRNGPG